MQTEASDVEYYVVRAYFRDKYDLDGPDVPYFVGDVRGMTDNGQPGWTKQGGEMQFKTVDDAKAYLDNGWLVHPYDAVMVYGSARVVHRHVTTVKLVRERVL